MAMFKRLFNSFRKPMDNLSITDVQIVPITTARPDFIGYCSFTVNGHIHVGHIAISKWADGKSIYLTFPTKTVGKHMKVVSIFRPITEEANKYLIKVIADELVVLGLLQP